MTKSASPAFQMYPNDFLGSGKVAAMSLDETGAFTLLLCYDWNEHGLPDDPKTLARWIRVSERRFAKLWTKLKGNFELKGGRWYNPRLEREREKQEANRSKKKDAAEARWHPERARAYARADASALQAECSPSAVDVASPSPASKASTTPGGEAMSDMITAFAQEIVKAANGGMIANPAIGEALNPIPFGHGSSIAAAEAMIAAGVSREFARSVVFEMGETFTPEARNRQIKSLGYCTDRVIERWKSQEANSASRSAPRPAALPARGSKRSGPREYDYKPTTEKVKWAK